MTIVGIEGSPRKNGNTGKLLQAVLEGARGAGAESRVFKLWDRDVRPCTGCGACRATGQCVLDDDMDEVVAAVQGATAAVLASPVYMWQVTATMKAFVDRLCRLLTPEYASRLQGPKKLGFVYTQGNPDPAIFAPYFEYHEKMFGMLGFTHGGRVLAAGTRAADDVLGQREVLAQARQLGAVLVTPA
jgi:multimeric flavodoxin WrbA